MTCSRVVARVPLGEEGRGASAGCGRHPRHVVEVQASGARGLTGRVGTCGAHACWLGPEPAGFATEMMHGCSLWHARNMVAHVPLGEEGHCLSADCGCHLVEPEASAGRALTLDMMLDLPLDLTHVPWMAFDLTLDRPLTLNIGTCGTRGC
jgi:hypothetical protein